MVDGRRGRGRSLLVKITSFRSWWCSFGSVSVGCRITSALTITGSSTSRQWRKTMYVFTLELSVPDLQKSPGLQPTSAAPWYPTRITSLTPRPRTSERPHWTILKFYLIR